MQFVVEMKIGHGEDQLKGYLVFYKLSKDYLLSSNFNAKKEVGISTIVVEDKTLLEGVA